MQYVGAVRRDHSARRCFATVSLLAALAACAGADDETSFDLGAAVPLADAGAAGAHRLTLQAGRQYGSRQGLISFGRIGRAAISSRGLIAASDVNACEVVVIDARSGGLVGRFGRCGQGSGEFSAITSLQFVGDSIVAFDGRNARLSFWSTTGKELHRMALPPGLDNNAAGVTEALIQNDSTMLLVAAMRPENKEPSRQGNPRKHLRTVNRRTGQIVASALDPPPVGLNNTAPYLNNTTACIRPDAADPIAVALNEWKFEAATFTMPFLRAQKVMSSDVAWVGEVQHPSSAGRVPTSGVISVACAKGFVVLVHSGRMAPQGPLRFPFLHLELRDYEGRLLFASTERTLQGATLDRVLAASDSLILVRGVAADGFPVLVEFKPVPTSAN